MKWYCLVLIDVFISTPSTALFRTYIYSSVPWSCLFEYTYANPAAVADCFPPIFHCCGSKVNDNMVFELDAAHLSLDATPMIAPRDHSSHQLTTTFLSYYNVT